jgi:type VI secretion system secreted protein VgrG
MSDANGDMRSNAGQITAGAEQSSSRNPTDQQSKTGGFNKDKFSDTLEIIANDRSKGQCATNIRQGLEAAGVDTYGHPRIAKDWGPTLEKQGFKPVEQNGYTPQKGDVAVIQPYPGGRPEGHITGYTGSKWVSDFPQKDMWGGPGYRTNQPPFVIYRHP